MAELASFRDGIEDTQTIDEVVASLADHALAVKQARLEAGTVHCGYEEAQATRADAKATIEAQDTAEEAASQVEDKAEEVAAEVEEQTEE